MGHLANGATADISQTIPKLWDLELTALSVDGLNPSPELVNLLSQCRLTARTVSDQLNNLFFSHSDDSQQSVGAS
jgi:hypothetical protein